MGDFLNSRTQGSNYAEQAMQARTQGAVARRQAYANAYKLEFDSAQNGFVAGEQMMTARQNALERLAANRNAQGASGFALTGSKLRTEQSLAEVLDAAIANMGKGYAVSDQNARWQAAEYRREGDSARRLASIQAGYYDRMASVSQNVAPWQLLGGGLGLASNILANYNVSGGFQSDILSNYNFPGSSGAAAGTSSAAAGGGNSLYVDPQGFTGRQRV